MTYFLSSKGIIGKNDSVTFMKDDVPVAWKFTFNKNKQEYHNIKHNLTLPEFLESIGTSNIVSFGYSFRHLNQIVGNDSYQFKQINLKEYFTEKTGKEAKSRFHMIHELEKDDEFKNCEPQAIPLFDYFIHNSNGDKPFVKPSYGFQTCKTYICIYKGLNEMYSLRS